MEIEPGSMVELNMSARLIDSCDILTICGSLVEDFLNEDDVQTAMNDSFLFISGIPPTREFYLAASKAVPIPFPCGRRTYKAHNLFDNLFAIRHV